MKIAEYKQIDVEIIENVIQYEQLDDEGNVVVEENGEPVIVEETVRKEVPVMGFVYREETEEEKAEREALEASAPAPQPSIEEKLEAVTAKLNALMEYQGLLVKEVGTGVYEVVKEDKASGDYTNPIQWHDGDWVTEGLYYYYDDYDLRKGALMSCIPTSWDDADAFEQF